MSYPTHSTYLETIHQKDATIRHLQGEINKLALFILEEVPDEPSQSEGAVDTAIRVIGNQQKTITELTEKLDVAIHTINKLSGAVK